MGKGTLTYTSRVKSFSSPWQNCPDMGYAFAAEALHRVVRGGGLPGCCGCAWRSVPLAARKPPAKAEGAEVEEAA